MSEELDWRCVCCDEVKCWTVAQIFHYRWLLIHCLLFDLLTWIWCRGAGEALCACKAGAVSLDHTSSTFFSGHFRDDISWIVCPGSPWTVILPILASQVARIKVWATSTWMISWWIKYLTVTHYICMFSILLIFYAVF